MWLCFTCYVFSSAGEPDTDHGPGPGPAMALAVTSAGKTGQDWWSAAPTCAAFSRHAPCEAVCAARLALGGAGGALAMATLLGTALVSLNASPSSQVRRVLS